MRSTSRNPVVILALGAVLASGLTAQQASQSADFKSLPRRFLADEREIWTSPFRAKNYDSRTVRKYIVPFILVSAALIATDRITGDLLPNTHDQAVWSGRVSQFGSAAALAGAGGVTYLIGRLGGNDHLRETGLLGLEAMGHTQIVVFGLKQITNRERPLDHDGHGSFWEGGNSFPSGHASSSFALATVFAYEYSDHIAVPITAYSLAGLISASRLSARRHWVSDIVVGGSLGFLLGRFTYRRNHNPQLPGTKVRHSEHLTPQVGISGGSFDLAWHW